MSFDLELELEPTGISALTGLYLPLVYYTLIILVGEKITLSVPAAFFQPRMQV
jgi:hypothetical protein